MYLSPQIEGAKSLLDKIFKCKHDLPPEYCQMKEAWDQLYDLYDEDVRGGGEEYMGAQNSEIPTSDPLVDVYVPTTQPTADISLLTELSYEGVSSFLGDDVPVEEYGSKGSITKRLRGQKIAMMNENFFTPTPANPQLFPIEHPQQWYTLSHEEMNSLQPGIWLYETVMDAYMCLLRDREVKFQREGINRWAKFGFMPSFFMHLGKGALSVGDQIRGDNFCQSYVTPPAGPPLHECDFIFMPICVPSNSHFILLTFMVSSWRVSILDPLYNDTPYIKLTEMYKEYVDVAVRCFPSLYVITFMNSYLLYVHVLMRLLL